MLREKCLDDDGVGLAATLCLDLLRTLGTQKQPDRPAVLGQLPFTGLLLGLIALLGAALASAGLGLRSYAHS